MPGGKLENCSILMATSPGNSCHKHRNITLNRSITRSLKNYVFLFFYGKITTSACISGYIFSVLAPKT